MIISLCNDSGTNMKGKTIKNKKRVKNRNTPDDNNRPKKAILSKQALKDIFNMSISVGSINNIG